MLHVNHPKTLKAREAYRQKIISDVRYWRTVEHKNTKDDNDYPNVIVACKCHCSNILETGRSMHSNLRHYKVSSRNLRYIYHQLNHKYYEDFGHLPAELPIFEKKRGVKLFYGTCAEDDAACKIFSKCRIRHCNNLRCLEFTTPIRPRTNQKIEYCPTCKALFS